jgi:hypothetical protein
MNRRTIGLMPAYTSATAPRNGRTPGSRNKSSAKAWKVINAFLDDFSKHGEKAITSLRIDRPADYARMVIASAEVILRREVPEQPILVVSWLGDDDPDPNYVKPLLEHKPLPPPPPAPRGPTLTANENVDDSPSAREDRPSADLKPPGGWGGVA